jgi:hypothetical protein
VFSWWKRVLNINSAQGYILNYAVRLPVYILLSRNHDFEWNQKMPAWRSSTLKIISNFEMSYNASFKTSSQCCSPFTTVNLNLRYELIIIHHITYYTSHIWTDHSLAENILWQLVGALSASAVGRLLHTGSWNRKFTDIAFTIVNADWHTFCSKCAQSFLQIGIALGFFLLGSQGGK